MQMNENKEQGVWVTMKSHISSSVKPTHIFHFCSPVPDLIHEYWDKLFSVSDVKTGKEKERIKKGILKDST